jgi:transposase
VIGNSTAICWTKRWRETGSFEAKSNKGQSRSPLKKHEEWLLGLVGQEPDLSLEEIQRRLLDERQQKAGTHGHWKTTTFVAGLRSRLLRHHASSTADERQCLPGLCRRGIR